LSSLPFGACLIQQAPLGRQKKKRRKNKLLFKPAQPVGLTPGLMLATY